MGLQARASVTTGATCLPERSWKRSFWDVQQTKLVLHGHCLLRCVWEENLARISGIHWAQTYLHPYLYSPWSFKLPWTFRAATVQFQSILCLCSCCRVSCPSGNKQGSATSSCEVGFSLRQPRREISRLYFRYVIMKMWNYIDMKLCTHASICIHIHTYIYNMTWHDMTWRDMTWQDRTWHDMPWHDMCMYMYMYIFMDLYAYV